MLFAPQRRLLAQEKKVRKLRDFWIRFLVCTYKNRTHTSTIQFPNQSISMYVQNQKNNQKTNKTQIYDSRPTYVCHHEPCGSDRINRTISFAVRSEKFSKQGQQDCNVFVRGHKNHGEEGLLAAMECICK